MSKNVPLNLKKSVSLPQEVVLPLSIHKQSGLSRRYRITKRDQEVTTALKGWMRGDPRYRNWFEEEQPQSEVIVNALKDVTSAMKAAKLKGGDSGEEQGEGVATWHEDMTVPELREYAAQNGVELAASDKKADVIAKLRDEGLPEQIKGKDGQTEE